MANYVKLVTILLISSILILGCGSDGEDATEEQSGSDTPDVESSSDDEDENANENISVLTDVLTELYSFTE